MCDKRKQYSSSRSNNVTNTFYTKGAFVYSNSRLFSRNHDGYAVVPHTLLLLLMEIRYKKNRAMDRWTRERQMARKASRSCHRTTASRLVACRNSSMFAQTDVAAVDGRGVELGGCDHHRWYHTSIICIVWFCTSFTVCNRFRKQERIIRCGWCAIYTYCYSWMNAVYFESANAAETETASTDYIVRCGLFSLFKTIVFFPRGINQVWRKCWNGFRRRRNHARDSFREKHYY